MTTFYRRLPRFNYLAPTTLDEALSLLARYKGKARVIAGGTDFVPKLKRREIGAPEYVIDLKGIAGLDGIKHDASGLSLGALVTIGAVETSPEIQQKFGILAQAAQSMASPQVRNRGTIAGNICNAVPSADSAPALLTFGAKETSEGSIVSAPPAVVSAIHDATGIWFKELPVTPEKVVKALKEKK